MQYSNKEIAQQVINTCLDFNVISVVISPGSRNAPLIIEFDANQQISKYSIVDERSAAFFALGIAKETHKPVALVCSSGSALLNYYPAIVEAFYSSIPLVVISADRPKEMIDIGDGQTIRQENVYQNHIKFSANLSEKNSNKNDSILQNTFKELINKTPIHINVPFSEPLYETTSDVLIERKQQETRINKDLLLDETPIDVDELQGFADIWNASKRKMILLGVHVVDEMIQTQLNHLAKDPSVIILTENTANVHHKKFITSIDQVIFPFSDINFERFKPDILLTFGGMVVSKKIKQLLRKNKPKEHWHIDKKGALDTYQALSHHFKVSATLFFSQFFFLTKPVVSTYQEKWLSSKYNRLKKHTSFVNDTSFSDLKVFSILNKKIPKGVNIEFSNSSTIRYSQLFSWDKSNQIGCNRGASGIDGSTSTAVGVAVSSKKQTVFVTGDLSFFYDSNALWNNYIPSNFRIIILNNGGGGIFRFIPGPTTTNTLDYFETPHQLTAKQLCEMHQLDYQTADNENGLEIQLIAFFNKSNKPKLLEIFTPRKINAVILKEYFDNLI